MTLSDWLALEDRARGRGALKRLEFATRISYTTLMNAKKGIRVSYDSAQRISMATNGAVTIDELCAPRSPERRCADAG